MITVLRIGHRLGRDARISTHVGLVSRAFGADKIVFSGDRDKKMMNSIREVKKEWGGSFEIEYKKNWKSVIKKFKGKTLHATMYGENLSDVINEIRKIHKTGENIMIIVGSQKVEREVYEIVDMNFAVGNQPHSEVAAIAIILHEIFGGKELDKKFKGGRLEVEPQEKGKKVIEKSS